MFDAAHYLLHSCVIMLTNNFGCYIDIDTLAIIFVQSYSTTPFNMFMLLLYTLFLHFMFYSGITIVFVYLCVIYIFLLYVTVWIYNVGARSITLQINHVILFYFVSMQWMTDDFCILELRTCAFKLWDSSITQYCRHQIEIWKSAEMYIVSIYSLYLYYGAYIM